MLAFLRGPVVAKQAASVVLDIQGIGFRVQASQQDIARLKLNREAQLEIYEHIREDCYDLYGFLEAKTKRLFSSLLTVNGVGPKMALALLDLGSIAAFEKAVAGRDKKYIAQASGVGPKLAEKIILELKNKVSWNGDQAELEAAGPSTHKQAVEALVSLGLNPEEAKRRLSDIDKNLSLEEQVKRALTE